MATEETKHFHPGWNAERDEVMDAEERASKLVETFWSDWAKLPKDEEVEIAMRWLEDHAAEQIRQAEQAAREAALEEAGQECEKQQKIFGSTEYATGQPVSSISERFACGSCAEAIRALKDKP
ncbi:MAG: hypothetical protein ACR2RF_25265 [Geminicoccaceae bacterium]